jgi:hypothetical protein
MVISPIVEVLMGDRVLSQGRSTRLFVYKESLYGCSQYYWNLYDPTWKLWEEISGEEERVGKVSWGILTDSGTVMSAKRDIWFNGGLVSYRPELVDIKMKGTDAGFTLTERCSQKAYVDQTIGDIVRSIATLHGLEADVVNTKGRFTVYQGHATDAELLSHLLNYSVSEAGESDYNFYVRHGNTLVFKPAELKKINYKFSFSVEPGGKSSSDLIDVSCFYNRSQLRSVGGLSKSVCAVNPVSKEVMVRVLDDDTALGRDKTIFGGKGITPPDAPSNIEPVFHLMYDDFSTLEFEQAAPARWSVPARYLNRVRLKTTPRPKVELGGLVLLDIKSPKGRLQNTSGKYLLYAVNHVIKQTMEGGAEYFTYLYLERRTSL